MVCSNTFTLNPAIVAAAKAQDDILTRAEAAAYLKVSAQTLMRYVRMGAIPCRKVDRRVIFSRKALERWAGNEDVKQDRTEKATEQ